MNSTEVRNVGWHVSGKAPRQGKGSATVEPIRHKKDLAAVKVWLTSSPRDMALFTLGINAGLRGSDLLGLVWGVLLSPESRIRTVIEVKEHKTGHLRRITLSDSARKALQSWLNVAGEVALDDSVFPSRKGKGKMSIQRLHQLVNEWCHSAGLQGHFGSHTLRKTYGYFHYQNGVGLPMLMKIFGHSSQAITLRYIGIEQDEIDEANLKLDL